MSEVRAEDVKAVAEMGKHLLHALPWAGAPKRPRSVRADRSLLRLGVFAITVSIAATGCATRGSVIVDYSLYPVNESAGAIGAVRGNGDMSADFAPIELRLPDGEVLRGEAVQIEGERFGYGGIYASAFDLGEATSVSPKIVDYGLDRISPGKHVRSVVTTGYGDRGTRLECEGYWDRKRLIGIGGCRLSDEALFRYHAQGHLVDANTTQ